MKSYYDEVQDAVAEGRHRDALRAQAHIMGRKTSKRLTEMAELQELLRLAKEFGIDLDFPEFFNRVSTFRAVELALGAV